MENLKAKRRQRDYVIQNLKWGRKILVQNKIDQDSNESLKLDLKFLLNHDLLTMPFELVAPGYLLSNDM